MERREFLRAFALTGIPLFAGRSLVFSSEYPYGKEQPMPFTLPNLPYAHDALEPYVDKLTMEIHHGKHHNAYVANLNKAAEGADWASKPIEEILASVSKLPVAVRNNGGGHYNHSMFWKWMKPKGGGPPSGELAGAIDRDFGSFEKFREQFNGAAMGRFGSGWAWLVKQHGKLLIASTPNQDNPLMDIADVKGAAILGLDVWEHAYYLKYQNRRADYVEAWWNVVNWEEVGKIFASSK
jgi:Fe-Mn family superoxide dismutase